MKPRILEYVFPFLIVFMFVASMIRAIRGDFQIAQDDLKWSVLYFLLREHVRKRNWSNRC